jgi:hypothetical protein
MPFEVTPEDLENATSGRFPHELETALADRAIEALRIRLRRDVYELGVRNTGAEYNAAITDVLTLLGEPPDG